MALELKLPVRASGPTEVGRLLHELEAVDQSLLQLGLRSGGQTTELPKTTRLLQDLAALNKVNLLQAESRQALKEALAAVRTSAPILHMSFSAEPSPAFMEQLMTWLRREIHPQVLVSVGLQPAIAAGCIVRSTNKVFDFSLRQNFAAKRHMLLEGLNG